MGLQVSLYNFVYSEAFFLAFLQKYREIIIMRNTTKECL